MLHKPKIMGILNITPDSCSDGGLYLNPVNALKHAEEMIEQGANIIDVGACSTRPMADPVSVEEEIARLENIMQPLHKLAQSAGVLVSLDSFYPQTVEKYLAYIDIINDVTGMDTPQMIALAQQSKKLVIFMHSMSIPVDNSKYFIPQEVDVIEFLIKWRDDKVKQLNASGISNDQLIFDPGIGFAKNSEQSMEIILKAERLTHPEIKLLYGYSRKKFLELLGGEDYYHRDIQTNAVTKFVLQKNIDYLRVHDVKATIKLLRND